MKKYLPLVLLYIFLFSNCKKENLSKNDKTKALASAKKEGEELLFTVKLEDPSPNDNFKFIITDTTGNLLSVRDFNYGEENLTIYGEKIKSNLINVYLISSYQIGSESSQTSIMGYLSTKKGSVLKGGARNDISNPEKSFKPFLKNIPNGYTSIYFSTGASDFLHSFSNDTAVLNQRSLYYRNEAKLYVQVTNVKGEQFYNLYEINPTDGKLEIDLSKCDKLFTPKTFTLPTFTTLSEVYLGSNNNSGGYTLNSYRLVYPEKGTNEIKLTYPKTNYFRPFYTLYTAYRTEAGQDFNNFYGHYIGAVPENIELLDAHLKELKLVDGGNGG